ncbi:MAG: hypothetical protein QY323_00650 [Patescibacteria group bacterium]|nr:MAG: hypothetical protein QY323_00650 [Patescibacteria group bacterium]
MRTFYTLIVVTLVSLVAACVNSEEPNCSEVSGCIDPDVDGGNTTPDGNMTQQGTISDAAYCPEYNYEMRCAEDPATCDPAGRPCVTPSYACGNEMWTCAALGEGPVVSCCEDVFRVGPNWHYKYCPAIAQWMYWDNETMSIEEDCPSMVECTYNGAFCSDDGN